MVSYFLFGSQGLFMIPILALIPQSSCLSLLSTIITGMYWLCLALGLCWLDYPLLIRRLGKSAKIDVNMGMVLEKQKRACLSFEVIERQMVSVHRER